MFAILIWEFQYLQAMWVVRQVTAERCLLVGPFHDKEMARAAASPLLMSKSSESAAQAFTLIEIMIVVAIIALLAAVAVPSALRARKRAQATSTLQTLRILDAATDLWAVENGKAPGTLPTAANLQVYVKGGTKLYTDLTAGSVLDALGNTIAISGVDSPPLVPDATYRALSDVAPSTFWAPYYNSGS